MKKALFILALFLGLNPVGGFARSTTTDEKEYCLTQDEKIPAGRFEWEPEKAKEGSLSILVSLPRQMLYVYRGSVLIARSSISSGRPGRSTPTGNYMIRCKEAVHHSNLYENAPMPFMQRLTDDGVALHAGYVADRPASHGCIRLPREFAKKLFGITTCGDLVLVTDSEQKAPKGNGGEFPEFVAETLKQWNSITAPADGFLLDAKASSPSLAPNTPRDSESQRVSVESTAPSDKTMRQLEAEELSIRNDQRLRGDVRKAELLRIWTEQRALMKKPYSSLF